MAAFDPPAATRARPFLLIPDVVRERIYAYVLTVNVPDSAPWIEPLPALSHARNKALATLPTFDKSIPIAELTAKEKKDRVKEEAGLRARENAVVKALRPPPVSSCLAILATCRTILLEAFHLWYQNNTLAFTRADELHRFLRSIGNVRANEICSLRLDLPRYDWSHAEAKFALGRLLKLERLTVVVSLVVIFDPQLHWHNSFNNLVPDIVKNVRGLREFEVLISEGQPDRALKQLEESKRRLMGPRPATRKPPKMVDLFGKLKKEKQMAIRELERLDEESLYAPDMASMLSSD